MVLNTTSESSLPATRSGRKRKATAKLAQSNRDSKKKASTAAAPRTAAGSTPNGSPSLSNVNRKQPKSRAADPSDKRGYTHLNSGVVFVGSARKSVQAGQEVSAMIPTENERRTREISEDVVVRSLRSNKSKRVDSQSEQLLRSKQATESNSAGERRTPRRSVFPSVRAGAKALNISSTLPHRSSGSLSKTVSLLPNHGTVRHRDQVDYDSSIRNPLGPVGLLNEPHPEVNAAQTLSTSQIANTRETNLAAPASCNPAENAPAQTRIKCSKNASRLITARQSSRGAAETIMVAMAAATKAQVSNDVNRPTGRIPQNPEAGTSRQNMGRRKDSLSKKPGFADRSRPRAISSVRNDLVFPSPAVQPTRDLGSPRNTGTQRAERSVRIAKPVASTLDNRRRPNVPSRDKDSTGQLILINRNLQQFLNDQNEHNKSVRDRLDSMEAQQAENRRREEEKHAEICRLLTDIRNGNAAPRRTEIEVPALYMYPTMRTQEFLIRYVVRAVLSMERGREFQQNVEGAAESVFNSREDGSDAETDVELPGGASGSNGNGMVSTRMSNALSTEIKAFLGSMIISRNRITVIETTATRKENSKNSVKARLLDQRRRFHDYVTSPVVNKWIHRCQGLEAFDTSLKTMKQDPQVFSVAANLFEKDEQGHRPYMSASVHGSAFYDACLMLKRISVDHKERALAQALKAFRDSDEVGALFENFLSHINHGIPQVNLIAINSRQKRVFLPHQLAFVQTKIHARLEWLSRCKLLGGKSLPKPDRSHYAVYVRNVMYLNRQTLMGGTDTNYIARNNGSQSSEDAVVHVLGVPLLPLLDQDNEAFIVEFYGDDGVPDNAHTAQRNIVALPENGRRFSGLVHSRTELREEEAEMDMYDNQGGGRYRLENNKFHDQDHMNQEGDLLDTYEEDEDDYEEEEEGLISS